MPRSLPRVRCGLMQRRTPIIVSAGNWYDTKPVAVGLLKKPAIRQDDNCETWLALGKDGRQASFGPAEGFLNSPTVLTYPAA